MREELTLDVNVEGAEELEKLSEAVQDCVVPQFRMVLHGRIENMYITNNHWGEPTPNGKDGEKP
jgi:hypothetical protein